MRVSDYGLMKNEDNKWRRVGEARSQIPSDLRQLLLYDPTYRAYKLRAIAVSVVPLMIARPSGNRVIS